MEFQEFEPHLVPLVAAALPLLVQLQRQFLDFPLQLPVGREQDALLPVEKWEFHGFPTLWSVLGMGFQQIFMEF